MRISDWSSDVCSSDLEALETTGLADSADKPAGVLAHGQKQWLEIGMLLVQNADVLLLDEPVAGMSHEEREETGNLLRRIGGQQIGRASCRERVCQYVSISVVAGSLKKKTKKKH